jgi:formate/nitrite transporter FocA (FNT family)
MGIAAPDALLNKSEANSEIDSSKTHLVVLSMDKRQGHLHTLQLMRTLKAGWLVCIALLAACGSKTSTGWKKK